MISSSHEKFEFRVFGQLVGLLGRSLLHFFYIWHFWIITSNFYVSNEEAQIRAGVERPSIHLSREHILRSEDRVLSEVYLMVENAGEVDRA